MQSNFDILVIDQLKRLISIIHINYKIPEIFQIYQVDIIEYEYLLNRFTMERIIIFYSDLIIVFIALKITNKQKLNRQIK